MRPPFQFTAGKPMNRLECTRCGQSMEWLYRDTVRGWEAAEKFKRQHKHEEVVSRQSSAVSQEVAA